MSLRDAWDANAEWWVRWARAPGHDSYWQFHGRRFAELVPAPGRLTVDLGAGEGRLGRDLVSLGHRVVALDASATMARACASHEVSLLVLVGDAAAVPLRTGCADVVVAFMSLQDVDDMASAVAEVGRLLVSGGRLCVAVVHPVNSAGSFDGRSQDAPFVIRGSYLSTFRYRDDAKRDGLRMTFHSLHRPIEAYSLALESSGFVIEAVREVTVPDAADRWSRIPLFLHIRARRE